MKNYLLIALFTFIVCVVSLPVFSQNSIYTRIDKLSAEIETRVINWWHHFHQYPELSNREFKTAAKMTNIYQILYNVSFW